MRVYRIAKLKWIGSFDGSGVPGKWNKKNYRMIYTSSSLALSLLEILVHIRRDQIPDYMWVKTDIRDELIESIDEIPKDPAEAGTAWLEKSGGKVGLAVPSVIVPEQNILLNPNNTDFPSIRWSNPAGLKIDPRLMQIA